LNCLNIRIKFLGEAMKSFKSIREGNYVEPGVSQIDDVPEDPLSFVEIKPKKKSTHGEP